MAAARAGRKPLESPGIVDAGEPAAWSGERSSGSAWPQGASPSVHRQKRSQLRASSACASARAALEHNRIGTIRAGLLTFNF